MNLQIALIGCGGHASVVKDALQQQGYRIRWIFDENPAYHGKPGATLPEVFIQQLLPETTALLHPSFLAIGDNRVRHRLAARLQASWVRAIHPTAVIHPSAHLEEGVYVGAYAVIQPKAFIGAHAIINTGAIVEHDCTVGAYVHLAPRVTLTGHTEIGEGSLIGVGSVSIPGITVGPWCTIGAGSVLLQDIPAEAKAFGVPCRVESNGVRSGS